MDGCRRAWNSSKKSIALCDLAAHAVARNEYGSVQAEGEVRRSEQSARRFNAFTSTPTHSMFGKTLLSLNHLTTSSSAS